jgi:hypothetical protein
MNATSHRLIEIASLFLLVFLCLWLTLLAIGGNYLSIFFILLLPIMLAASKEPYRKGFIAASLIVGVFLIYPIDMHIQQGNHLRVKFLPIVYGLPGPKVSEKAEREEIVEGGCVVYPWSAQWRIQVTVP